MGVQWNRESPRPGHKSNMGLQKQCHELQWFGSASVPPCAFVAARASNQVPDTLELSHLHATVTDHAAKNLVTCLGVWLEAADRPCVTPTSRLGVVLLEKMDLDLHSWLTQRRGMRPTFPMAACLATHLFSAVEHLSQFGICMSRFESIGRSPARVPPALWKSGQV